MSDFDLTSMVDFALETTNAAQLIYIGHSQGTMIQFAQLSKNSAFAAKIKLFIALGPVVHVGHIESPIRVLGKKGEVHTFTYIFLIGFCRSDRKTPNDQQHYYLSFCILHMSLIIIKYNKVISGD